MEDALPFLLSSIVSAVVGVFITSACPRIAIAIRTFFFKVFRCNFDVDFKYTVIFEDELDTSESVDIDYEILSILKKYGLDTKFLKPNIVIDKKSYQIEGYENEGNLILNIYLSTSSIKLNDIIFESNDFYHFVSIFNQTQNISRKGEIKIFFKNKWISNIIPGEEIKQIDLKNIRIEKDFISMSTNYAGDDVKRLTSIVKKLVSHI